MKGMPEIIQTRRDAQNLFQLAQEGALDRAEVAKRFRAMLGSQYHAVPILSMSGDVVTTRYFAEVLKDSVTHDGLLVKSVEHIKGTSEDDGEDNEQFVETNITLSSAPAKDLSVLSIYVPNNVLVSHAFDIAELEFMLGVLES